LRRKSIEAVAARSINYDLGSSFDFRPVVMLPDEMDRLISHHQDSDPATNLRLLEGRSYPQGPTRAHLLEDAVVSGGMVLCDDWVSHIRSDLPGKILFRGPMITEEAAFCTAYSGERYFGHWITDNLPCEMLANQEGWLPVGLSANTWPHSVMYRELTGLFAQQISAARFKRLWFLEDHEFNRHKRARFSTLRQRIRSTLKPAGSKRVFLRRGSQAVGRAMANEDEVADILEKNGFEILLPERMDVVPLLNILAGATTVVVAEGSVQSHAFVSVPTGTGFAMIMPPRQFNLFGRQYIDAIDGKLAITIGEDVSEEKFVVQPERLLRVIDLLDRH